MKFLDKILKQYEVVAEQCKLGDLKVGDTFMFPSKPQRYICYGNGWYNVHPHAQLGGPWAEDQSKAVVKIGHDSGYFKDSKNLMELQIVDKKAKK